MNELKKLNELSTLCDEVMLARGDGLKKFFPRAKVPQRHIPHERYDSWIGMYGPATDKTSAKASQLRLVNNIYKKTKGGKTLPKGADIRSISSKANPIREDQMANWHNRTQHIRPRSSLRPRGGEVFLHPTSMRE